MTKYNSVNIKLSNSQLDIVESAIKTENAVTLRLSSNMTNESNNETNFPHNILLHKTFVNNSSTDKTLWKIWTYKIVRSG